MKKIVCIFALLLLVCSMGSGDADEIDDLNAEIDRLTGQLENMTANFTSTMLDFIILELEYGKLNVSFNELGLDYENLTIIHDWVITNMTAKYNELLLNHTALLTQHIELQASFSTIAQDYDVIIGGLQTNIIALNADIENLDAELLSSHKDSLYYQNETNATRAERNTLTFQNTALTQELGDRWRFSPVYLVIGLLFGAFFVVGLIWFRGGKDGLTETFGTKKETVGVSDTELEKQYDLERRAMDIFNKGPYTEKDVDKPENVNIPTKKTKTKTNIDPIQEAMSDEGQKQIHDEIDTSTKKSDYSKIDFKKGDKKDE